MRRDVRRLAKEDAQSGESLHETSSQGGDISLRKLFLPNDRLVSAAVIATSDFFFHEAPHEVPFFITMQAVTTEFQAEVGVVVSLEKHLRVLSHAFHLRAVEQSLLFRLRLASAAGDEARGME